MAAHTGLDLDDLAALLDDGTGQARRVVQLPVGRVHDDVHVLLRHVPCPPPHTPFNLINVFIIYSIIFYLLIQQLFFSQINNSA
jgi:hypothetical protein